MPSDLVRLRKRKESTNYQLQITVPADLRQHFNGQRLIRQSLGTGDRKEAEARALRAALPIWQRFCELRQPAYAQPSSLDQGLFLEASLAYLNDRASEESRRVAKLIEDGKEDERAHAEASWDALHSLLADEVDPEYGQPPHRRLECEENHATANAVLARLGLSLDALSPTDRVWALREAEWLRADLYLIMEECCAAIPTGVRRAEIFRRRRDALPHLTPAQVAEAPTRTPSPNQDRPRRGKTKTLSDVLPEWQARTNAKPHAIQDTERALALWEEATENPAIGEISRETGSAFVQFLLNEGQTFKRKTAANYATCINALMNVAVECGYAEANPLRMKFAIDDSEKREPWSDDELKLLHGTPVQGPQPFDVDPVDADLLLSLLLWSGARIGEIASLRVQDISERDGVLAAHIRRETTKTDDSVRWLPIASAIRDKVLAHAQLRRDEGCIDLMPSFTARKGTKPGDLAGRWFRKHRQALGLPPGGLNGSHRYRHTVRTRLASVNVSDALADAITGHAPGRGASTGRRVYTARPSLPAVLAAVDLLAWPWPRRTAG